MDGGDIRSEDARAVVLMKKTPRRPPAALPPRKHRLERERERERERLRLFDRGPGFSVMRKCGPKLGYTSLVENGTGSCTFAPWGFAITSSANHQLVPRCHLTLTLSVLDTPSSFNVVNHVDLFRLPFLAHQAFWGSGWPASQLAGRQPIGSSAVLICPLKSSSI